MTSKDEIFAWMKANLETVSTTIGICNACGEECGRDWIGRRKDNGEPWIDPFKPADPIAFGARIHRPFCEAQNRGWNRILRHLGLFKTGYTTHTVIASKPTAPPTDPSNHTR